jgi:uncharacterized protein YdeI (BOF family)
MQRKELAKYSAVFVAGAFAVLGVIGINSLVQPQPLAPLATQEQVVDLDSEAAGNSEQQTLGQSSETDSQEDKKQEQQTKNSSAASQPAASASLGAGAVVDGVSRIGSLSRNTMVTVEGTVTRINDEDEFVIADSTGSIQVYTGRTFFSVDQGQKVTVRGLVDDGVLLEIYADEIVLPDGSVVEVRHWG